MLQSYLPNFLSGSFCFWEGLELDGRSWRDQLNNLGHHSECMVTHSAEMRFLKVEYEPFFFCDFDFELYFVLKLTSEKTLNFHTCKIDF